jgi:hypothetical protein
MNDLSVMILQKNNMFHKQKSIKIKLNIDMYYKVI